ncbi:unnamed protein product [Orchesella dallaii]|uniref:Uncharacterized protein n=1 Tax=Orchesella dallaii TaxID=48710 RepID=A0ABP1R1S4_9HEXA
MFLYLLSAVFAFAIAGIITFINNYSKLYKLPPGPVGNWLPIFGYLPFMGKSPHLKYCELGKKYGDAFTIKFGAYPIVVLNKSSLIRECFKQDVYCGRPNYLLAMKVSKDGLTFATGPEATEQRRFVLKTLRDLGFGRRSMEKLILDEVQELVHYFKNSNTQTHHLEYLFGLSVINALWSILATRKFSITDPYAIQVYKCAIEGFIDPPVSGALWFLPIVAKLFPKASGYSSVVEAVKKLRSLVSEVVEEHKIEYRKTGIVKDFVDAYIQKIESVQEEGLTNSSFYGERGYNNLVHVLIDLFTAGSDTLNSSLNFALKYLCENRNILVEVQKEIDNVVGNREVRLVNLDDKDSLPLLDSVIQETLRLSSIVSSGILHSTTHPVNLVTDTGSYMLDANTIVMPNLYWVNHNPEQWENPDSFFPHRFIGNDKKHDVIAFSTGKRVCIAEVMAQTEFFLFLGGILANFNIQGGKEQTQFGDIKPGLVLNVHGLILTLTYKHN